MRTTIDLAGRVVVPKALRDELGLSGGTELELEAVDGRLEITVPSRVHLESGPYGLRFSAAAAQPLSADEVRALSERGRR
jgi:AbrB family looped-hinge helix DNA binding protein